MIVLVARGSYGDVVLPVGRADAFGTPAGDRARVVKKRRARARWAEHLAAHHPSGHQRSGATPRSVGPSSTRSTGSASAPAPLARPEKTVPALSGAGIPDERPLRSAVPSRPGRHRRPGRETVSLGRLLPLGEWAHVVVRSDRYGKSAARVDSLPTRPTRPYGVTSSLWT